MDWNDPDEQSAFYELTAMSKSELDLVPFVLKKWVCSGKGCNRHTKVRDYGTHPFYYRANMIDTQNNRNDWHAIDHIFFMCAKHFKLRSRLVKNYPIDKVYLKIFDLDKPRIQSIK